MTSGGDDPGRAAPAPLTYASAGVDIDAGNEAVRRIRAMVETTRRPEQLDAIGGFAGMITLPEGMRRPVLVSGTDGVGTKLLVAIGMDRHDTVGIDLVAMVVNDILVTGASALFLQDYVATGKLEPHVIEQIVAGVVEGCRRSGCALLGGETAELPGLYADGHYDLAATVVGVVEQDAILGASRVQAGDAVLGLPSSGLHSNGFSLARKALLDPAHAGLALTDALPGGDGETVGEAMLRPTRIYEPAFAALRDLEGAPLHAAAHITGGGLLENPQRALPDALAVELDLGALDRPGIFDRIAEQGVEEQEMRRTFNCGVGMLLYVDPARAEELRRRLADAGEPCVAMGRVVPREDGDADQVRFVGS